MNRQKQRSVAKYMTSLPPELHRLKLEIEGFARGYGLDFFDVIFEVLDWNQLNEVASYGGFPNRYPHWRFGMEYEQLSKSYSYGLSKIYEMVVNTDPCYAYLLYSNSIVDQKLVMAHVYAHCDFFKNNVYFAHTNRKMMDEMANHKTRILRYIDEYGQDQVEDFIDACLSVDTLIDYHAPAIRRRRPPDAEKQGHRRPVRSLRVGRPYLEKFINPEEFIEEQRKALEEEQRLEKRFPESPEKDVMLFLLDHAPLERWERDVLSMIREEAYYFAPQGQTKILNEGWACVLPETLVFTDRGLMPIRQIVEGFLPAKVHDGDEERLITDYAIFADRCTVNVRTRRGFELGGSDTHRVLSGDGVSWKRLDEISVGDRVAIGNPGGLWPERYIRVEWELRKRTTLSDVSREAGTSVWTVIRHMAGSVASRSADQIEAALPAYASQAVRLGMVGNNRKRIRVPELLDEKFASFLGYLIGDGHISLAKRTMGLTTGDEEQAKAFAMFVNELFDIIPHIKREGERYRVSFSSEHLRELLEAMRLKVGRCARDKSVPPAILFSPKSVVAAFLRSLFDCDGYAGPAGVILSTSSERMSREIQLLLLNFGMLSTRRLQQHDIWNVEIRGASAKRYLEEIGFGLERKSKRLREYVEERRWFKEEDWTDDVVSIERGRADVYDITVADTHRYCAHGFVNHNSFWHSKIMTEKALVDSEVIDYADHHSGTVAMGPTRINPYKIGLELLRDIEDRWNKGKFGKEYEECTDMAAKRLWDRKLGLGRQKIFEVRRLYSDVTFIDEYLTPEFCQEHKLFVYAYNLSSEQMEIATREFGKIKKQFLFQLTNFGSPHIAVSDGNFRNRGELLLHHFHEGVDLRYDYACATLKNLFRFWRRPVGVETVVEGVPRMIMWNGSEIAEERA
jgi:stage V sporulation protein R